MENANLTGFDTLEARSVPESSCITSAVMNNNIITPPLLALPEYGLDAVSFYTGVGGLDLGAEQSGLRVRVGNDNWKQAAMNYPLNFGGIFNHKDVLNQTGDEILEQLGMHQFEVPCVFGGPPCPGWSGLNRKRNEGDASLLDTNLLTFKYISLISQIKPICFVMEQVDGLGDLAVINGFHELKMRFKEELRDYVIQAREIRTLLLGVPQQRTRWIFIGWLRNTGMIPVFPKPIKGSLSHLTIAAIAPDIDYIEIKGSRILRKENTEFFSTIPATEHVTLMLKDGRAQKLSERPDLLLKIFGYPDDFKFHPDLSFPQIHRLIGNSVPPPMAKAVFTEIVKGLRSLQAGSTFINV